MILSNSEIKRCIKYKCFDIENIDDLDEEKQYNTTSIDLRLGNEILFLNNDKKKKIDISSDVNIAEVLTKNSKNNVITDKKPYILKPNKLVLGNTFEKVNFKLNDGKTSYAARVEGKSSLARCGIIVHFSAPTIHTDFHGPITLEIINLGPFDFVLKPKMYICQLIIEEVKGNPFKTSNRFKGQKNPAGTK